MNPPVACSVGTTDPWNAAGLGLDARVFAACGVRATAVVAGVSAQDRDGVRALHPIDPATIAAQFAALARANVAAFRVGALLDVDSVEAVASALARERAPVVHDPVLGASAGGRFGGPLVTRALVHRLAPQAALLTPNLVEARELARAAVVRPGRAPVALADVEAPDEMHAARACARRLIEAGAAAVLVTGLARADEIVDVYIDARGTDAFAAARLGGNVRGTGCALASAIAAHLALGAPLRDAIVAARAFVRARIADAIDAGGMRIMNFIP